MGSQSSRAVIGYMMCMIAKEIRADSVAVSCLNKTRHVEEDHIDKEQRSALI